MRKDGSQTVFIDLIRITILHNSVSSRAIYIYIYIYKKMHKEDIDTHLRTVYSI